MCYRQALNILWDDRQDERNDHIGRVGIQYSTNFCFPVAGEDFKVVQQRVADLLKDRILVGHALHNDLKVSELKYLYVFNILSPSGVNAVCSDGHIVILCCILFCCHCSY